MTGRLASFRRALVVVVALCAVTAVTGAGYDDVRPPIPPGAQPDPQPADPKPQTSVSKAKEYRVQFVAQVEDPERTVIIRWNVAGKSDLVVAEEIGIWREPELGAPPLLAQSGDNIGFEVANENQEVRGDLDCWIKINGDNVREYHESVFHQNGCNLKYIVP